MLLRADQAAKVHPVVKLCYSSDHDPALDIALTHPVSNLEYRNSLYPNESKTPG